MTLKVLINGVEADGVVPVTDSLVLRGDGCFEVIRSYRRAGPSPTEDHLDRLDRSASKALEIRPCPTRRDLERLGGAG